MKKMFLIGTIVLAALAVFATAAFALAPTQPAVYGPGGGYGSLSTYYSEALAAKLGISVDEVNAALVAGKSHYQIALDAGVAEADIPALLSEVHAIALDAAVADGVLTQEQADFMKTRMNGAYYGDFAAGRGGMHGGGYYGAGMMGGYNGGNGTLHTYMAEAFASKLGLSVDEVNAAMVAGTSMYQLALDNGVAEADLQAFLTEVHTASLDAAVADGVITQEQADFMTTRMNGQYGGCNGGYNGDVSGGFGGRGGRGGGMMRGGGWQQFNP